SRGACSSEVLSEDVDPERERHPGAFVEPRRAGLALGVDAEADAGLAASREFGERRAEEEPAEAAPAPAAADAEHADPAHLEAPRALGRRGDLVAVEQEPPQRRVEVLRLEPL